MSDRGTTQEQPGLYYSNISAPIVTQGSSSIVLVPEQPAEAVAGDAPGCDLAFTHVVASGAATGDASVTGIGLGIVESIGPGAAVGASSIPGSTLTHTESVAPGAATGAAEAGGVGQVVPMALLPSGASGEALAAGQSGTVSYSLVGGGAAAVEPQPGNALGADLSYSMGLAPGVVSTGVQVVIGGRAVYPARRKLGNARGVHFRVGSILNTGKAGGAARTPGVSFVSRSVLSGAAASGSANVRGIEIGSDAYDRAMIDAGVLSRTEREWLLILAEAS